MRSFIAQAQRGLPGAVRRPLKSAWIRLERASSQREARSQADIAGRGTVVASSDHRSYLARVIEHPDSQGALNEALAIVVERLVAAGIEYFLVSSAPGRCPVVGVATRDRLKVIAALDAATPSRPTYLGLVVGQRVESLGLTGARRPAAWASATVLRLAAPTSTSDGFVLTDESLGCDVEFWTREGDDLVPPRTNAAVNHLTLEDWVAEPWDVAGALYASFAPFVVPSPFEVQFPIDAVYTWVDGDDPHWLERKDAALGASGEERSPLSANDSRYASRDELRYSLRSLDRYAGWIRHIYLVTDDQVPDWLDTDNPRISVVSHRELFADRGTLPTFNSHAIETQLHRIEGLAEHFLYLNDDVFFGSVVQPETFFLGNGTPLIFPSKALIPRGTATATDAPVDAAGKNNRAVIQRLFDQTITNKFKHTPHALRRSTMAEVREVCQHEVDATSHAQFRRPQDVAIVSLAHYYGWFTGRAAEGIMKYDYVDTSTVDAQKRLDRLLGAKNYTTFCLNDTDTDPAAAADREAVLMGFLKAYFPLPSRFER